MRYQFPDGFRWGAATSAYQIEGAVTADGRGESIWDRFSRQAGRTLDGSNGDVACDHYYRWEADLDLMVQLGIRAYRFSVAWPRVLPEGRGSVNQAGLDFYRRLVDGLQTRGIEAWPTLYHWDLPVALQDAGGWPVRATAEAFAEYTAVVAEALSDEVAGWFTVNEPWCVSMLSHQIGAHAPGLQDWPTALAAAHHTLLAHGMAVTEIRRHAPATRVGAALNFTAAVPASPSPQDRDAARWFDGYFNRWFLDPIYGRGYPADMVADYSAAGHLPNGLDFVQPGDMAIIAAPTDFLGVNYYSRAVLRADVPDNVPQQIFAQPADEQTAMGWDIYPEGLYSLLLRLTHAYAVPAIYITENGVSYPDAPGHDGRVRDERRIRYLDQHLAACARAMAADAPLQGYFVWSLLDNFEWERGYDQRFGIVYVDFATQTRILKDSFRWYSEVIMHHGR